MSVKKPTLITSLEHLRKLAYNRQCDCFISLAGGMMRSSKDIYYYPDQKKFEVFSSIDETIRMYTDKGLARYTNIVEAIEKKALFKYNY